MRFVTKLKLFGAPLVTWSLIVIFYGLTGHLK